MDQLRAQLGNYLDWLESRGLTGTVAIRTPVDTAAQEPPTHQTATPAVPPTSSQVTPQRAGDSISIPYITPQRSDESRAAAQSAAASSTTVQGGNSVAGSAAASSHVTSPRSVIAPHMSEAETMVGTRNAATPRGTGGASTASPYVPPQRGREPMPASRSEAVAPVTPQREAGMPWKVGFYSSSDLTEQEFIMVSKIALALGLPAEDFHIWAEDSLVRVPVELLRCSYIVALGPGSGQTLLALGQTVNMNTIQKALQGSPLLTIPHPRAMLREPSLKGGAWTALQKFKAIMIN